MRMLLLLTVSLLAAVEIPTIKLPPGEQPVQLQRYAVRAVVHGLVAEVRTELTFANPNQRALEGMLEFPLPDDATICGYALDVQGRMVDGVIVGKDQARVVLEAESRRRVDPGIAEHVAGNVFRTRIFPVAGTRSVAITWTAPLTVRGDEAALRLPLPRTRLPELSLRIEVAAGETRPELSGFGNLSLTAWRQAHLAEAKLTDVTPGDDLLLRLPRLPAILTQSGSFGDESFVGISAATPARLAETLLPRRIAVAWDASASRAGSGARSRDLLLELMRRSGCAIDLVVFRNAVEPPRAFTDAAALAAHLDALVYDGATALAALDLRQVPHAEDAWWLLLSDGLGSVGEGLPATGGRPVCAVVDGVQRDAGFLRLLTARTGGRLVDAAVLPPGDAAQALLEQTPALMRIDADSSVLTDVQIVPGQGRDAIFARLRQPGAATLVYGVQGHETSRTQIRLESSGTTGGVLARAWAGARACDLATAATANHQEIVALGRRYGLVTPGTSLLVLESLDQYLRHRVEPPASWPEQREAYMAALKNGRGTWDDADRRFQQSLIGQWEQRVAWWDGRLPRPEPVKQQLQAAMLVDAPAASATASREEAIADHEFGGQGASLSAGAHVGFSSRSDGRRQSGAKDNALAGGHGIAGVIAIAPFEPNAPYLVRLRAAAPSEAYAIYLAERQTHADSPSFFLDCGGLLLRTQPVLGRRVLSNLLELRLDDPALLRAYAWRLQEAADHDEAISILRRVLRLRPEEPQSYRDLALALAVRGELRGTAGHIEEALALLRRVALRDPLDATSLGERSVLDAAWDRFPGIEVCALEEFNRLAELAGRRAWDRAPAIPDLDPRLRRNLDCDLRVSLSWDRDATDIDLHVLEPSGEEAYYGHQRTASGALVSPDCTQGYGPEEYLLRRAPAGSYQVQCHFFGSRANNVFGPATVTATVFLDWGRPSERRQVLTLRLDRQGQNIPIGTVAVGGGPVSEPQTGIQPLSREAITALKPGMNRGEIEGRLGRPLRVDGGGVTVLVYRLDNGHSVRVGCGPELLWAREVLDGAERDLLR